MYQYITIQWTAPFSPSQPTRNREPEKELSSSVVSSVKEKDVNLEKKLQDIYVMQRQLEQESFFVNNLREEKVGICHFLMQDNLHTVVFTHSFWKFIWQETSPATGKEKWLRKGDKLFVCSMHSMRGSTLQMDGLSHTLSKWEAYHKESLSEKSSPKGRRAPDEPRNDVNSLNNLTI